MSALNDIQTFAKNPNKDLERINKRAAEWKINLIPETFKQTQEVAFSWKAKTSLFSVNTIIPNVHKMVKNHSTLSKNGQNAQTNICFKILSVLDHFVDTTQQTFERWFNVVFRLLRRRYAGQRQIKVETTL